MKVEQNKNSKGSLKKKNSEHILIYVSLKIVNHILIYVSLKIVNIY